MDLNHLFMISKRWIKNGVFASDTIELNGCVVCNPTEDMLIKAGYKEYVEPSLTEKEKLEQAKADKIAEITAYDTSSAVNGFVLNGAAVWLDKATRVGLMNSTAIAKAVGNDTTVLWLGDMRIEMSCDKAIQLLSALEMYALECFNVTAAHKKAVAELTDIGEVLSYDYTKGYPEKLTINLSEE